MVSTNTMVGAIISADCNDENSIISAGYTDTQSIISAGRTDTN